MAAALRHWRQLGPLVQEEAPSLPSLSPPLDDVILLTGMVLIARALRNLGGMCPLDSLPAQLPDLEGDLFMRSCEEMRRRGLVWDRVGVTFVTPDGLAALADQAPFTPEVFDA